MSTLTRNITLGIAAAAVAAAMSFGTAAEAEAKSKIHLHLGFGVGGYGAPYYGPAYAGYYGYGPRWGGSCYRYLRRYKRTGRYYWKKKFRRCMAYY